MASPSETRDNNGNSSKKKDEHTETMTGLTGPPNPFSVIFKREYNFFLCWYLHLAHNFNASALDVLHGRLSEAYQRYINANHDDKPLRDSDVCNGNNNNTYINGIMNIHNNGLIDSSPNSFACPEQADRNRQLEGVIDAIVQLKETMDLIERHMAWLEELKLDSLLIFPQLYCKKPSSSLMSLMAMCSKTRLFIRCVLENLKLRDWQNRNYNLPQNPKYGHVDEKFVKTYVPHCLKLEYSKKPRVLKPCTCNVRLNPALVIVNSDQKDHSARIPQN